VAKVHNKIKNTRNTINHQASKKLINLYDFIGLESLQVKNMLKNRRLSKAIPNKAWSDLASKIDTYYPSSKTCSNCSSVKERLLLEERIISCSKCSFEEDRGINASINVLNEALRLARIE